MSDKTTLVLTSGATDLDRAADLLRAGQVVAFPTETVYGLGADARNGEAVAAVYAAKGRPSFNPLIAHVADLEQAQALVEWSDEAERLACAFWPGPLTMVLPLKPGHEVSGLVTAGLDTLAVRVPAHPVAQGLLQRVGGPVAAPSANPSGRISPTTAAHVLSGLDGRIAAVVEAGSSAVGLESTIVGLSGDPVLLRPGGVPREEIERVLGREVPSPEEVSKITAPGQMLSHYAPRARVVLNHQRAEPGGVMLGFGDVDGDLNLSPAGSLTEAASNLFEYLHRLDAMARPIAVAPIPDAGLGAAINDRLQRAAADRDQA
ncbi:MAG: L-threonylcarbamoyladenylate synthase [Paracoccaceae bacterium]